MNYRINPSVNRISISGIRQFSNLVQRYPDALSLTIGQPDFPTPDHVKNAAKRAIDDNRTVYTPNAGLPALRQAVSHFYQVKYGLHYQPENEVIVTTGATEAIDISLRTILEPGTEVILPGPVYPGYAPAILQCGARPVYVDTSQTGFRLTKEGIASKVSANTRCIILPSPSNPTGVVLTPDELAQIADIAVQHDLLVLSDEIYSELVYDGEHVSIASLPGMQERTIVVNGLSKSHSMTGWRIGFVCAPHQLLEHIIKVHQYAVTCASSVSQYAALAALTEGIDDAVPMRQAYEKRRDFVLSRLMSISMPTPRPAGAFYVFPSVARFGMSSWDFATKLLEEERLAVVPGLAFDAYGDHHVRLSYAYPMEQLGEGMRRLERFVRRLESARGPGAFA